MTDQFTKIPDDFYRWCYYARRFDEIAIGLQRQGAIGNYSSARGQEVSQLAAVEDLGPTDMVFPSYRQPGVGLRRGVRPRELLGRYARRHACPWDWRTHGFAPYCIPVGSQLSHAVGWAHAAQRVHEGHVTITFFGDGASSQGEVHEAMNFAGVLGAPVVFVLENNGWAISLPIERQTACEKLVDRAAGYGIAGVRVDGTQPVEVLAAASAAVARARGGEGPTLLEVLTYRAGDHTTADNAALYRDANEVAARTATDPLDVLERNLSSHGVHADQLAATRAEVDAGLDAEIDHFLAEEPSHA